MFKWVPVAIGDYFLVLMSASVLGLSAGLSPGPLSALVLTQALQFGTREGIKVAFAPIVTDAPVIVGAFLLVDRLESLAPALGFLALAGSGYLFFLAYETAVAKPFVAGVEDGRVDPMSLPRGVLANLLNPHPYIFWISVGGPLLLELGEKSIGTALTFLAGFYLCLVGSKVGLAVLAGRSRAILGSSVYTWTLRLLGLLLVAFAVLFFRVSLPFWEWLSRMIQGR